MTEPVRVVHHGDPDDPFPIPVTRPAEERIERRYVPDSLPVTDPAQIVEEVITRRLVVVDRQNRERLVAEEDQWGDLALRIAAPGNDAAISITVGDEGCEVPSVLATITAPGNWLTIHASPRQAALELETLDVDAPTVQLCHDGLEVHHWHAREVPAEDRPFLDSPEAQVDDLLERLGLDPGADGGGHE